LHLADIRVETGAEAGGIGTKLRSATVRAILPVLAGS
jgi:hypothetical protein